ncbi:hypothetical protein PABG_11994 [Paracoccidioides brasiliensis Pb03]|nr:hypothetical protein PABG_11994 [Paracoccidioides brasiliensis Pb03]
MCLGGRAGQARTGQGVTWRKNTVQIRYVDTILFAYPETNIALNDVSKSRGSTVHDPDAMIRSKE